MTLWTELPNRLRIRIAKYSLVTRVVVFFAKLFIAGLIFWGYASILRFCIFLTIFCKNVRKRKLIQQ
jgi:hypothetical protein